MRPTASMISSTSAPAEPVLARLPAALALVVLACAAGLAVHHQLGRSDAADRVLAVRLLGFHSFAGEAPEGRLHPYFKATHPEARLSLEAELPSDLSGDARVTLTVTRPDQPDGPTRFIWRQPLPEGTPTALDPDTAALERQIQAFAEAR